MRDGLEHRDPFAVNVRDALEALKAEWGDHWFLRHEDRQWCARSRGDARILLTCETPDELVRAMRGWGGTT